MNKKIEISTLNVSIRILTLDNKRFTKSIYKQLPTLYFGDGALNLLNKEFTILGFVVDDSFVGKSFLINKKGVLYRFQYPLYNKMNKHRNNVSTFEEYHKSKKIIESYGQIFITS